MAIAAIAVGSSAVSSVLSVREVPAALEAREPDFVKRWKDALPFSTRVAGSEAAPIVILALIDLECPICRSFHQDALEIVAERAGDVQLRYVHYPLSYHRSALAAARGAECARDHGVGAFARWVDVVYSDQASLGRRSWRSYAAEAGLPNPELIEQCASDSRREDRVTAGIRFGEVIGLEGTPTVIINGWRYFQTPTSEELRDAVDALVKGSHG